MSAAGNAMLRCTISLELRIAGEKDKHGQNCKYFWSAILIKSKIDLDLDMCTNMWEKGYRRGGGAADVDKGTQGREACWIGYPFSLTSISAKATLPAVQPRYLLQHNVQEDIRYKQISGRSCSLSIGSSVAGKYPTYWNIGGGGSLGVVAALDIGHGEPPAIGLGQPPFRALLSPLSSTLFSI